MLVIVLYFGGIVVWLDDCDFDIGGSKFIGYVFEYGFDIKFGWVIEVYVGND